MKNVSTLNLSNKLRILSHHKRIDIIYLNVVHKISVNKISKLVGHHYSTVSNIIQTFQQDGRTSQPYSY